MQFQFHMFFVFSYFALWFVFVQSDLFFLSFCFELHTDPLNRLYSVVVVVVVGIAIEFHDQHTNPNDHFYRHFFIWVPFFSIEPRECLRRVYSWIPRLYAPSFYLLLMPVFIYSGFSCLCDKDGTEAAVISAMVFGVFMKMIYFIFLLHLYFRTWIESRRLREKKAHQKRTNPYVNRIP